MHPMAKLKVHKENEGWNDTTTQHKDRNVCKTTRYTTHQPTNIKPAIKPDKTTKQYQLKPDLRNNLSSITQ